MREIPDHQDDNHHHHLQQNDGREKIFQSCNKIENDITKYEVYKTHTDREATEMTGR